MGRGPEGRRIWWLRGLASSAQRQLPLHWPLLLTWSPSMATRRWCRNRIKKRRLSERSEFPTLPDFGAGGVCSPCEARTAIIGVAFSWLLLLAKQEK
jgi:hypothetical protein